MGRQHLAHSVQESQYNPHRPETAQAGKVGRKQNGFQDTPMLDTASHDEGRSVMSSIHIHATRKRQPHLLRREKDHLLSVLAG
jgi:hypothetical protein